MANSKGKFVSSTIHGEVYSMKLSMLFLIRGINAGYKFKLGTELEEEGGKFDDIIFKYKVGGTKKRRCIQAKHKLTERTQKDGKGIIKLEDLMCDDGGNFSLPKYFRSYCDHIKGYDIDDLVICTNYDVDNELISNNHLALINDYDSILGFKDESGNPLTNRYKINNNELTLKELLKGSCGPIYQLAKKLFDCANKGKPMDESKDEIFKRHHVTLICEKVIDLNTKQFHQDFAKSSNLSADAQRLRQVIVNMSKSSEISKLWGKKLKIGNNFGTTRFNDGQESMPDYSLNVITDIDEFLNKFVLAITPHEETFSEILKKELVDFSKHKLINQDIQWGFFLDKIMEWFKKRRETHNDVWMTSEYGQQEILKTIDFLIDCFHIRGISLEYRKKILNILEFHLDEIEKMNRKLEELFRQSKDINYYEIQSPSSVKICANKVISALKTMDKYKADDSFLVVSAKKYKKEIDRWNDAILKADGYHHLLVLICDDETCNRGSDFNWHRFMPSQDNGEKKLILIVNNGSDNCENVLVDDAIVYDQLSDATKEKLFKKTILFQGVKKSISGLIAVDNQSEFESQKRLFDSSCLAELLLSKQKIEIPSTSQFKKSIYIKRKIRRWVWPSDQQFWAKVAEKLNCTVGQLESELKRDETSSRINWKVKDDKRKLEIIKAISEINSGNQTHFKDVDESDSVKELKNSDVFVISGVAGTGKSTILSHIYEEIKLSNPNQWVISVNLINHCDVIKEFKHGQLNGFFVKHWHDFNLGNGEFAKSLFTERLKQTGNVTFLFDGFDEIGTELQNKTIELIKELRQTKADAIYVTTRSHMNETLQNEFFQFPCSLRNFTKEDQIEFLKEHWGESLNVNKNQKQLQSLAESLVDKISNSLKDDESKFIGIPLQCRILAECFEPQLKGALRRCFDSMESLLETFNVELDLVGLYKLLMKTKQEIYCKEKKLTNLTNRNDFERNAEEKIKTFLRKLAIETVVEDKKDTAILLETVGLPQPRVGGCSREEQFKQDSENEQFGLSYGLLQRNRQDKLEFLHRTYAEYLVADFIYLGFHLDDDKHNNLLNSKVVRNFLVKKIFKKDLYEGVMRFFNCMLKPFVESDNWRRIIMKNDERKDGLPKRWKLMVEFIYNVERDERDYSETTLLYLAMRRNFASFFTFLCDCLVHSFYPNLEQLTSAFEYKFKECIYLTVNFLNDETSCAMFKKLLSIYETSSPSRICSYIVYIMTRNMKESLDSGYNKNFSSCWNNEEKRKKIKYALEFLTKHKFIPENPIDGTYQIVKFFFHNEYYDEIITSLVEYLLVFEDDRITEILQLAFRRYSCRRHWQKGRNEFMLKQIVQLLKTKGRSDLINGLHCEILVLGDEEGKREILLSTDAATSFYRAAACGYENDCREILKQQQNYSDCKEFTLKALGDAILFKNIEMFRLTLEAIKQIFSLNDLEDLLQSDMSDFVECYKYKRKRREKATVFVVIDDEEMFNDMIGIFVGDRESFKERDRLDKLFLQNESTLNKIALFNEEHLRVLFPTDKFKDWLNYVMNKNIEFGFRLITKLLINIPDHLELLKIITQPDGNQSGSSYWNQWFEEDSKLYNWHRLNNLEELLVGISSSLGVGDLIEKLLLHDDGYAIACGLHINTEAIENAFDSITNLKDEFAKKWIQFLPDVLKRVSSRLNDFGSLDFILPMMEHASDDQLSNLVNVILEKDIWFDYITNRTDGLEIPDQFLKLVSTKLGDYELEKLVFHRSEVTSARNAMNPECHHLLDMLLSHLKSEHQEKVGKVLIKLPPHFDESAYRYMNIFPILVKYSNEKHLKEFVDNITTRNTIKRDKYESSVWAEYLCCLYNLYKNEPNANLVASFLKWTSENLGNDYIEKLIFHEDGRLITRVLLFRDEEIVNAVLNHVPIEFYRKIAKFLMKNAVEEYQNPKNEKLRTRFYINTLFLPFLKKHAESQELVKFFNDTITQERNNNKRESIWIKYIRNCVEKQEMDKVEEFWSFLSQNVDANKVCKWMGAFSRNLEFPLAENDEKFVKENWFYLLPQHNADTDQVTKLIDIITHRCDLAKKNKKYSDYTEDVTSSSNQENALKNIEKLMKIILILHTINCDLGKEYKEESEKHVVTSSSNQKNSKKKWSIWSYYIDHDVRCTSITIDKLLDCVRATKELGSSKVKELVLHKTNEGDDPVVVRASFNGEKEVEAMLRYLNDEDREEVKRLIKAALD